MAADKQTHPNHALHNSSRSNAEHNRAGHHGAGHHGAEHDDALIARAGRGDRLAASELVVRHTDKVMAVCYRLLNDRAAAEDVVQETFLKLWKNAGAWTPGKAQLSTWLYRVARNACVDRLRRAGREAPEDAAPERADQSPSAEAQLIAADRASTIEAALQALPARQREAIVLCHYQELSNGEAAEILGASVEAVESLLARARRTLKASLAPMREALTE
ncbi:MAG: RNA polymerase sigma factor [Pseudomonadota bacterium]